MKTPFKLNWFQMPVYRALGAISLIVLASCGSQPPAPDWALTAEASAQKATQAYLQGEQRIEALQWQKAREAVASTAQPEKAARLELMRCAAQVASLYWDDCPAYQAFARDASAQEQAYARYLQAQPTEVDVSLLPEAQRTTARYIAQGLGPGAAFTHSSVAELEKIKDPLSRLVTAAVLMRAGGPSPQLLQLGVDTASAQGWRRPLMAWLMVQQKTNEMAGNPDVAAQAERRLQLLQAGEPLKK